MSKTTRSHRNRHTFADKVREQLWLTIPLGFVAFLVVFGVINARRDQPDAVESFAVETPGAVLSPQPEGATLPGEAVPTLEAIHISAGETATYNSNPPTSGAHYEIPAAWGIHSQAPLDEELVHNLEHGGIVISYDPDQIKGQTLEELRTQTRDLSEINPRVVLTPRENLDAAIALTAWGYLQTLDNYNPTDVKAFYDAHIARRGPECRNGQCPG